MNSSACILQCPNPQELAQKQLESQGKKKEINKKYYQKKKQELDELERLKVQLGVKHVDFETLQNGILSSDQLISSLQLETQRKDEEYIDSLRNKDAEIDRMRLEHERQLRENSRERIIADVGQHIALMSDRIGKLEVCENRVKQLQKKADTYEAWHFFLKEMNQIYPNVVDDIFHRLQNKRLYKPLEPPSLDKLVAESKAVIARNVNNSPAAVFGRST